MNIQGRHSVEWIFSKCIYCHTNPNSIIPLDGTYLRLNVYHILGLQIRDLNILGWWTGSWIRSNQNNRHVGYIFSIPHYFEIYYDRRQVWLANFAFMLREISTMSEGLRYFSIWILELNLFSNNIGHSRMVLFAEPATLCSQNPLYFWTTKRPTQQIQRQHNNTYFLWISRKLLGPKCYTLHLKLHYPDIKTNRFSSALSYLQDRHWNAAQPSAALDP